MYCARYIRVAVEQKRQFADELINSGELDWDPAACLDRARNNAINVSSSTMAALAQMGCSLILPDIAAKIIMAEASTS